MADDIAQLMVRRGTKLLRAERVVATEFTQDAEANRLVNDLEGHPHAFLIACLCDRQMKAEKVWRIPYDLGQRLGGATFSHLRGVGLQQVQAAFREPSPLHRYPEAMAQVVHGAIQRVANQYGGDASRIWTGRPPSAAVVLRFLEFHGAGPKIATMAANILARDFKVEFSDYYSIDVSVDVHLRRVFTRLGLVRDKATVEEIVYRARSLHPEFPGLLDLPAWEIGRTWCRPGTPQCGACYLRSHCPTATSADGPRH